jgi:hypothetical protein
LGHTTGLPAWESVNLNIDHSHWFVHATLNAEIMRSCSPRLIVGSGVHNSAGGGRLVEESVYACRVSGVLSLKNEQYELLSAADVMSAGAPGMSLASSGQQRKRKR